MDTDEWFVERLKEFCPRAFHLEVYQRDDKASAYPCVVYSSLDCIPVEEIGVNPSFFTTVYIVNIIGKNSADIRTIADTMKETAATEEYQDLVYCGSSGRFCWVSVTFDTEENLFAKQQEDKGYKVASLQFAIQHWSENGM